jgi:hypothetical protein
MRSNSAILLVTCAIALAAPAEARKEGSEKPPDTPDALLPPFDLSDAAVCEMINRPLPEDAQ